MHYHINVNLTEEDYFEFNKFVQFNAPTGKKNITVARIIMMRCRNEGFEIKR